MTALTPEQQYKTARFRHQSGDYDRSPEVRAAEKAQEDLIARTWRQDRSMTRDEKRLYAKYQATIDADTLTWFDRLKAQEGTHRDRAAQSEEHK